MTRETVPPISRRERRAQERLDRPAAPRRRSTHRQARPVWKSPVVLVTVAAIVVGVAVIAFARPGAAPQAGELITPPTSYPAAMIDGDVIGLATAPVVIKVYSDFQCPACKLFVTTELQRLVSEFVVPGTVRIEANDIDILGSGARNESLELAAGAACAAKQGRYWAFHDLVFWNQLRENHGDYDQAYIARVADAAGVDRTAWDTCLAAKDTRQPIIARSTAAGAAGIRSTPTLVVNGQLVVGVPDYNQLAALIRALVAQPSPTVAPS
ncbi:MAG TPA: thioredoxin domain-containing protein [Candidatus Dormibacteraeota bacterium]|nr:thioredoxin domain-containing protein [Candidatus Dormibacteraeota bacterium]